MPPTLHVLLYSTEAAPTHISSTVEAVYNAFYQRCGLRPSVLGQDRSETKKSVLVLVLYAVVLVLRIWCGFVKHDLVPLVMMILKDTSSFQVLFIVSLFCAWNITTVEINSGVHLLKSQIRKVPLFVYFRWSWSWSCYVGLVLF